MEPWKWWTRRTRWIQKLEHAESKERQHHLAPLMLWEQWLLVGTDDGRVLFYTVR